jgi:hypothetical protein
MYQSASKSFLWDLRTSWPNSLPLQMFGVPETITKTRARDFKNSRMRERAQAAAAPGVFVSIRYRMVEHARRFRVFKEWHPHLGREVCYDHPTAEQAAL